MAMLKNTTMSSYKKNKYDMPSPFKQNPKSKNW